MKMVRNLGARFDYPVSMNSHIGKVCSKTFRSRYIIRQTRKFLSEETRRFWCILSSYLTSITVTHCSMVFYSSNMTVYKGFSMQRRVWSAWSLNSTISLPPWEDYTGVQFVTEWCLRYSSSWIRSVDRLNLRSDSLDLLVVPRTTFKTLGDKSLAKAGPSALNEFQSGIKKAFLAQICGRSRVHFGFYHRTDMIINSALEYS